MSKKIPLKRNIENTLINSKGVGTETDKGKEYNVYVYLSSEFRKR